jgi:Flp pilus assembly protein TadB
MSITEKGRKTASEWTAPLGVLAGLAVATLFRRHLNAEYSLIVVSLCAATLALIVFAVRQTSKNQQREQLEFEEKLHQRRRTNSRGTTSNS